MESLFPRYPLMRGETPLHPLPRFAAAAGLKSCWVKRDDLTGIAFGGNKVRKLEYLLGDALKKGCDLVITGGSPQSNHARLTAAAARRAGLDVWLCFAGSEFGPDQGNLLLDRLLGARCIMTGVYGSDALLQAMMEQAEKARTSGRKPYVIPVGGSTPAGDYGYVRAWETLLVQLKEEGAPPVDRVVLAAGSGGTLAGLLVGRMCMPEPIHLTGISVWLTASRLRKEVRRMAEDLLQTLNWTEGITEEEIDVRDAYIGPKYGVPSEAGNRALRLLAETEGLFVDPIYTAKALAGLMDMARKEDWSDQHVLFWHTGGTPAIFTHAGSLMQE